MTIQWGLRARLKNDVSPSAIQFSMFHSGDLHRLGPVYLRAETPNGTVEGWRPRPKDDPENYVRDLVNAATYGIGGMIVAAAPVTPDKPLGRYPAGTAHAFGPSTQEFVP